MTKQTPVGAPLVGALEMPQYTTRQPQRIAPTAYEINPAIVDVVGAFKSLTTNEYIAGVKQKSWSLFNKKLWQRNYYEHIIRSEQSYLEIAEYIQNNPLKWLEDKYYE